MSRLDSFNRRLMAQRDILNAAGPLVPPQGDILEVDKGKGRTFGHLREPFPLRRIVAFDRALAAPDGLAISGLPLATPKLSPLELPQGIQSERYFLYRKSA